MRRVFAASLLLLLFSQSSGAALAATGSNSITPMDLAALITPVQSAIVGSRLYALLTGTTDRYEAMHAPPPTFPRAENRINAAELMRSRRAIRPKIRQGVRQLVTMPDRSALDPHHRRLDPLAMRRSTVKPSRSQPASVPVNDAAVLQPLRTLMSISAPRAAKPLAPKQGAGIKPMTATSGGTGIEHWWTYEERAIPGVGKAMVNVGTGNLVVAATDVDVPEQGIDLTFQRVYNAQSLHDNNGDDGGDPAIFGNRWTNNFDASIVYDPNANTITVYDLNGTACTYTTSQTAPGGWQPCTGEYATLVPTDSSDCTYAWTKPNGTVYWFHTDASGSSCGLPQAKRGRLQQILARNQNNAITFTYSYDSSGQKTSEHITEIDANHSDGDSLVMKFGVIAGTWNELATITLPDNNATLQYSYDSSGNLVEVDKPGTRSAFSLPNNPNGPNPLPGDVPETYAYVSGTSTLQEVCGPRCTASMWQNQGTATDGGALLFTIDSSSLQMTSWQFQGVLNFTPDDGTKAPLQANPPTTWTTWYTANFFYAGIGCGKVRRPPTRSCWKRSPLGTASNKQWPRFNAVLSVHFRLRPRTPACFGVRR